VKSVTPADEITPKSPFIPQEEIFMPTPYGQDPASNPIIGDPRTDVSCFPGQQSYPDTCAIRCQEFILERFTGVDLGEVTLVREACDHGWYTPGGGTSPSDVGNLLELYGIPVTRYEHSNIWQLTAELAQGHKVILGVDSGEMWHQNSVLERIEDRLGISGADHAVVVSGIDTTDPDNPVVIVSDPGTGDAAATYPLVEFLNAWEDSGFFMVATQDPAPPALNPEMINFDYVAGHIPEVAGVNYEDFAQLEHQSELWESIVDRVADLGHFGGAAASNPLLALKNGIGAAVGGVLDWLDSGHGVAGDDEITTDSHHPPEHGASAGHHRHHDGISDDAQDSGWHDAMAPDEIDIESGVHTPL